MSSTGCTHEPRLGLNMHPKWLRRGPPEAFLLPLREIGVSILEFKLDLNAHDWPEIDTLIHACRDLGFGLSFHTPHKGPYRVAGFSSAERKRIEQIFAPVIDYAAAIAGEDGPTPLVVHGAKGTDRRESLRHDTKAFLNWMEDRAPDLEPALELRIREPDVTKVGDSKRELLALVSCSSVSRVGICWDIGHDARNGGTATPAGFIERVTHVHVHDLSPHGEDHHPLLYGNAPFGAALRHLRHGGYEGSVILEVNGQFVGRAAKEEGIAAADILRRSFREIVAAFSP